MARASPAAIDRHVLTELFETRPTKSQRTKLRMIEAAIRSYATIGIERTNFDRVAEQCGSSRTLVHRYFGDQTSLLGFAIKFIRGNFQRLAIEAIQGAEGPEARLGAYVSSTFEWVRRHPDHVKVWLLFFYYCGINRKFRELNTELVSMGHERITALVVEGCRQGVFRVADPVSAAKMVQTVITGALMALMTEELPADLEGFREKTIATCLRIVREG